MKVLVVEDEHKIANALKQGLEQEGFVVDVMYDSDSGLSSALYDKYDLMVFDRMLPGSIEGLALCQQVRAKGIHTPILLLTAKDQVHDRIAGLDAGADDYLIKPFAFEELLARLRALLRRPKESISSVLTSGDLSLDTVNYEAKRAGVVVQLSRREFALLEYLMRNQSKVISKDTIISHVWDFDADILPNTVEVYIGYLRQKIDKPFKSPGLIHTMRGFGYKFGVKK